MTTSNALEMTQSLGENPMRVSAGMASHIHSTVKMIGPMNQLQSGHARAKKPIIKRARFHIKEARLDEIVQ